MKDDTWLGYLLLFFIFGMVGYVCYHIGRYSSINDVERILVQEERVTIDSISLENIRLEISKLR